MKRAKWFIHPVFIFVLSTAALAFSLFLYIYWYIGVSEELNSVIRRYQLDASQFFEAKTWVVILILSLLVGLILVGILIIFIYNLKTQQLYRLQHNFINNFTHELKTPVTSLKLYLETFAKHDLPREEQLKYIGFMLQDVERLSVNINSILNLARIESRLQEGEPTSVDLPETIQQFINRNRHIFHDCDIHVARTANGTLFYPVIIPLFEILLMNILVNAKKYNVSGKPRIDITFEKQKETVLIHFRDNGIGFTFSDRKKIFTKFYQSRNGDRTPVGGSGIGLYLVQQIARLHGGKMVADSEGTGQGAVFTLILPAKAPGKEEKMKQTDKKRILIVEDDAHIAEGLKLNLTLQGYDANIAGSGPDGLQMWKEWNPHLIVLDVMLPGLDGLSVLRHIRLQDERIPVLILSAKGAPDDRIKGFSCGVDDYLAKPFNLEEFLLRIERLLTRSSWVRIPSDAAPEDRPETKKYSFGRNTIDFTTMTAECRQGRIQLTEQEARLLKIFIANRGKPLSRKTLLEVGWGYSGLTTTRTVDSFLVRLRKYFEDDPQNPVFFRSLRSVGYLFDHPDNPSEPAKK